MIEHKNIFTFTKLANILAFTAVIIVNVLSNTLPLNGRTAGEISDTLPSYFTPAGYTFSIWGLIYTALLGFTIYQALPQYQERPFPKQIGWLFVLSSAANVSWLFAWHYGAYLLSILLMLTLLASLISIYLRLNIGHPDTKLTTTEVLFVHTPFSLYLGWITVATIANIASVAAHWGWAGFGLAEPIWAAIMMAAAVAIAAILLFNRRNWPYASVLVWALFGIRAAHPQMEVIANTAVIAAALIIIFVLVGYIRTGRPQLASSEQTRLA